MNGVIEIIMDILYKEKSEHTFLPTIILVFFNKYNSPTLTNLEEVLVIFIIPIQCM